MTRFDVGDSFPVEWEGDVDALSRRGAVACGLGLRALGHGATTFDLRKDEFRPAKDVLKATWETYNASRANSSDRIQSLAIVNFLFERGARHKKFKKILPDYIAFLDKRLLAFEKEWDEAFGGNGIKNSEEASKWAKEWSSRRDKIYDECFEHVFGSWTNATWHAFDKAWRDAY